MLSADFSDKKENILFVGSSGVGKTHLATSIGITCARSRISTYFIPFESLITQLKKALLEQRIHKPYGFLGNYLNQKYNTKYTIGTAINVSSNSVV